MTDSDYTGIWMTADSMVRKILLPNGRYLAMIGGGATRHQGEYRIVGDIIQYRDDGGGMGESVFIDGVMYHGTVALYPDGYAEAAAA